MDLIFFTVSRVALVGLCTAVLWVPNLGLAAQPYAPAPTRDSPPRVPMDTLGEQLATISTDTGAFTPGHQDFSGYDTPGLCRAAARLTRAGFQLSVAEQDLGDTLAVDTVGLGATAVVARACGARLTLANTRLRDFSDLFDLALYEQNDGLAQEVLTKLVAQDVTSDERRQTLRFGMQSYLKFGRLAATQALLTQIDAQGASARVEQMQLHSLMMHAFGREQDTLHQRQEAERIIAFGHDIVVDSAAYEPLYGAYRVLMALAVWGEHPDDSFLILARLAKRDLSRFNVPAARFGVDAINHYDDWRQYPLWKVIKTLGPGWYVYDVDADVLQGLEQAGNVHTSLTGARSAQTHPLGRLTPRLQADYWFSAPGHPAADTVVPVPGKVNVVCDKDAPAVFRRWLALYGVHGLEITVVQDAKTWQEFWAQTGYDGWDEEAILFKTPAAEARVWQWYDQVFHQSPVRVAVQIRRTTQWLPAPDGRRQSVSEMPFDAWRRELAEQRSGIDKDRMTAKSFGECAIIGRDGWAAFIGDPISQESDDMLKWLFSPMNSVVSSSPATDTPPPSNASSRVRPSASLHPPRATPQ